MLFQASYYEEWLMNLSNTKNLPDTYTPLNCGMQASIGYITWIRGYIDVQRKIKSVIRPWWCTKEVTVDAHG